MQHAGNSSQPCQQRAVQETRKERGMPPPRQPGTVQGTEKGTRRRRPPRTAAVAIKGFDEKFSYAQALRIAQEKIELSDLKIYKSRVRKAANGGVIVEIPGPQGSDKADNLAKKLSEVMSGYAEVTRPTIKGEIIISGFDESVTADDIFELVSRLGGCRNEQIKVGAIRRLPNGNNMVWVQCPVDAAILVAEKKRLRIRWTTARVEMLQKRPTQCYKCWRKGHIRNNCPFKEDYSKVCFRCGGNDHPVKICTADIKCRVCADKNLSANHRVGSNKCSLDQDERRESIRKETQQEPDRRVAAPPVSQDDYSTTM
ncbi:uncharacterized protein LOC114935763 [Nylanderia fulva]|uniref:uncharacterized protein LOC114935763 n=1 Tax=Nylanderia fulva TaxID=613905 RepID=UPI0010FAD607|nr:uncharacterized protein LOC114935763 [Nylanderia fulva]